MKLSDAQTVPCQVCNGASRVGPVHINRGPDTPGEWRDSMPCKECAGTGSWSMERWERWQAGREMRERRIAQRESLYEAGKRLGISPAELSGIERGHEPQTEAGRAALNESES